MARENERTSHPAPSGLAALKLPGFAGYTGEGERYKGRRAISVAQRAADFGRAEFLDALPSCRVAFLEGEVFTAIFPIPFPFTFHKRPPRAGLRRKRTGLKKDATEERRWEEDEKEARARCSRACVYGRLSRTFSDEDNARRDQFRLHVPRVSVKGLYSSSEALWDQRRKSSRELQDRRRRAALSHPPHVASWIADNICGSSPMAK